MKTLVKKLIGTTQGNFVTARFTATVVASGATLVLDAMTPLGLAIWLLQVVLVWISSLWANARQMISIAVTCSVSLCLGFWFTPRNGFEEWIAVSNLLLSLVAVWAITHTTLRQRAAQEAQQKTAEELVQSQATVGMLRDLLPLCAWCKKIRNEADGWDDLETYILNYSKAQFTHSVCPDCAAGVLLGVDRSRG
jgi:hypothetical protein